MNNQPKDTKMKRAYGETIKVLFPRYLSAFGIVRGHPQFHLITTNPPPGYEFVYTCSGSLAGVTHLIDSTVKIFLDSVKNGINPFNFLRFVWTRGIWSQLQIPRDAKLVFLPSLPCILGQNPWVIEIEDTTPLFFPFLRNGQSSRVDVFKIPIYPAIKALFESDSCKGIVCHMKSTAENFPLLFKNDALRKKITHIPLGIPLPQNLSLRKRREDDGIRILFTNSYHQQSRGFYLRGGLDILEAFSIVVSKYPNLRLILRTALPPDLDGRYMSIIKSFPVEVIERYLTVDDMRKLMSSADIYVLPSARIHVVSILQAMAHGLAIVVSDGWGINEYIEDGRNGIVVRGRYGKSSWMDEKGMLREDYSSLFSTDSLVVSGLVDSLSTLIEDRHLRESLGQSAMKDVENRFSIDKWNRGLRGAFEQALSE